MEERPNLRPRLNRALREIDRLNRNPLDDDVRVDPNDVITVIDAHNDLRDAMVDVLAMARRHAENQNDYEAILVDIVERAQEALNG